MFEKLLFVKKTSPTAEQTSGGSDIYFISQYLARPYIRTQTIFQNKTEAFDDRKMIGQDWYRSTITVVSNGLDHPR